MRPSFGIVSLMLFLSTIVLLLLLGDRLSGYLAERIAIIGFSLSLILAIISKGKWRIIPLSIYGVLVFGFIFVVVLLAFNF